MSIVLDTLRSQFTTLPYPDADYTDQVVIVTGSNVGLGLEAARHFVRLNASKVILACRSVDKGEAAREDIEATTQRPGVAEVWQLDLTSFDSVKEFAARAAKLDRLDVLINNAAVSTLKWQIADGHELMTTVNVLSPLLLTVMLLPTLRRSGGKFNTTPHVVIVSSDGAFMAFFKERKADSIIKTLATNKDVTDRYNLTKLLELMVMRSLASATSPSGKPAVIINSLNPGLCRTQLFRSMPFPLDWVVWSFNSWLGREAEMGSRTLMTAAAAGEDSHGKWMTDCRMYEFPRLMTGEEGEAVSARLWGELLEFLEGIEPGVTANI